jgi:hypothetical protein
METTMELDELKSAWQSLERRLELDQRLRLHELRERGAERLRGRMRPLFWGQALQMLFGIAMMLLGVGCWARHVHVPLFLASGLVVHAYGLLVLLLSMRTLVQVGRIDFSEPVVAIQAQLAKLRQGYLRSGYIAGLPWWVLWMPVLLSVAGNSPLPYEKLPPGSMQIGSWIWASLAVGAIALLGLVGFYRWACQPGREALRRRIDDFMTSPALRDAQAQVDELARFERDAG